MANGKITKRLVDSVQPAAADRFVWDEALKGFGLKVTSGGAKVYIVQYRMGGRSSATKRHTIGRHGSPWTPLTAREEAERFLSQVARAIDPHAVEQQRKQTAATLAFDQYVERYLREYGAKRWRPSTYPTVASNLRRYVVPILGNLPLSEVTRPHLLAVFDGLPADALALPRNVYAHASRLFSWAVERGDLDRSPFDTLKAPPPVASRDRVLNDQELCRLWIASAEIAYPFGPMVKMLLLTGQRRNEVAAARWEEFDRATAEWTIPHQRAKNKSAHQVPLSAACIEILDGIAGSAPWPAKGLLFTTTGTSAVSGHSRAKDRIDDQMRKLAPDALFVPWRIHDLRRTLATGLQRLGVRFEVTEAVLNHVSGSRSGVAGVYQRHSWRAEKREALNAWTAHIQATAKQISEQAVRTYDAG